ncbi:MAG: DUF2339 domain-containing protein [Candidatus Paceibacterota bacterium]|jgi:uncharacterized membrane protein
MEFIFIIGGVIILLMVLNLRGRVQKLEEFIKNGAVSKSEANPQSTETVAQQSISAESLIGYIQQQLKQGITYGEIQRTLLFNGWSTSDVEIAFKEAVSSNPNYNIPLVQTEGDYSDKFVKWLKEDWLLKLGAFFLLIGFGWLTNYAFRNGWIGPMGQISLGIIAGSLFIMLGWWRIQKYVNQGGVFMVLGSTVVLLTIFAAREVYGFFTPTSALVVMFLSTVFIGLASVKYKSQSLALSGLILAGIAPLLTNSPTTNYIGLFSYLFAVILGAIWIVFLTGGRKLTLAALILVTFYSLPHIFHFAIADKGTLLIFAYAFTVVFFITNTMGILKLKDKEIIPDLITAMGNGLFILIWIITAAQDEWKSLIIALWMVIFTVGAFIIFKITERKEPFYVYAGVGIAMLATATTVELKGVALTIAYIVEAGMIPLITYLVLNEIKLAERMSLLLIGPIALSFGSIVSSSWSTGVLHKDFFVILLLGVTLLGLGLFFLNSYHENGNSESQKPNPLLLIAGSIYIYILIWLSLHAALDNDSTAIMFSLVIYTIIGLVTYFYGLSNGYNTIKIYGGILLGSVVVRLLLVDVWRMELSGKIIMFFLIGALLVSTAFYRRGKKSEISINN